MLSRLDDVRVFESSDDVVIAPTGVQNSRQQQQNVSRFHIRSSIRTPANGQQEPQEGDQLHPQHPHRMRKRVLRQGSDFVKDLVDTRAVPSPLLQLQSRNQPMAFVFLSSGEIRAREDCPPGLQLPQVKELPPSSVGGRVNNRIQYQEEFDSDEESDRLENGEQVNGGRSWRSSQQSRKMQRQSVKQPTQQRHERFVSSLSSARSESSVLDADGDISSGDDSGSISAASSLTDESEQQDRHSRVTRNAQHSRHRMLNASNQKSNGRQNLEVNAARNSVRNGAKRTPNRSLDLGHLCLDDHEDEAPARAVKRGPSAARRTRHADATSSFQAPSADANSRTARLSQLEDIPGADGTADVQTFQKKSPKMKVSHLLADEPISEPIDKVSSSTKGEANMISRLEMKLQKEKKRVLEKMTQLLEEQGKNQHLHTRIEALENQVATKDNEQGNKAKEAAREQEDRIQTLENEQADRIKVFEEQVQHMEANIARLERDKEQLKAALRKVKMKPDDIELGGPMSDEVALRAELNEMTRRVRDFFSRVGGWKTKSKKTFQRCDDKADLASLLEHVWQDFPQFPGIEMNQLKDNRDGSTDQRQSTTETAEQSDALLFLKKRLRQREEELRQTHVKYVELKELCARQCVREADLQNFINEHRLRGNLIIRKKSSGDSKNADDNQEHVQDDRQREARVEIKSTSGANRQDDEEEEENVNEEYSDNQEDNDGYEEEEEEEYEYPVRPPKVFVQVGRDGVYEHMSPANSAVAQKVAADRSRVKRRLQPQQQQKVERIRLTPSSSLNQRYERVPTPSSTSARRKRSVQQQPPHSHSHCGHSHPGLNECPPGCGSRLSYNRKRGTPATQRAKSKRPVATTTVSKGASGVIRPWM